MHKTAIMSPTSIRTFTTQVFVLLYFAILIPFRMFTSASPAQCDFGTATYFHYECPPGAPSVDPGATVMPWSITQRQILKISSMEIALDTIPGTKSVNEVRENPYYGIDGDINDNYPFAPPEPTGKEDEAEL
ncbi:hypothetical protein EDD18DRAFT_1111449 [Armillaria luteobubalina]|uniref:Uncharacterized protein n=1 Tax=Armillaria luteobubalina TaxID=153913 RepID=A0AA39PLP9_9AGAR|nr:hypothetical protein EDD18DRAFT_1111449 [Armillaria luteobubalina]